MVDRFVYSYEYLISGTTIQVFYYFATSFADEVGWGVSDCKSALEGLFKILTTQRRHNELLI